jgi:hypothetical protein
VWLLGNLFRTEKRLCAGLGCAVEVLRDHDRRIGEQHGELRILRGAILIAAELSDFFEDPRISDHDRGPAGCKRPNEAKQHCPNRVKKHTSSSECSTCALPCEVTAIKLNQQS